MDFTDLVHSFGKMIFFRKAMRSPAIHFALIGAFLLLVQNVMEGSEGEALERQSLVLPALKLMEARQAAATNLGRPLTPEENKVVVNRLADEEILFRYAMDLGLQHTEVPQARLARISSFVSDDETLSAAALATSALDLGLHEGDLVTRRILIDAASRLIREPALRVEPTQEDMETYLNENAGIFRQPSKVRIAHVLLSDPRREDAAGDAWDLLTRLQREAMPPDEAVALSDPGLVPPDLPLLTEREIERRFGHRFMKELREMPTGEWAGPLRSRYGSHVVFVYEREDGAVPSLERIEKDVRARWRQDLANRWLEERLKQLRASYVILVGPKSDEVSS